MTGPRYVPVEPREHSPECRRKRPDHPAIDRENCERCRALWQRLQDVHDARAVARRYRV